ncbi:reticulon-2a isoform X2 [Oryzias melastigma]|nr:reticulon-2a isoform X2 [Oryzias melastigma]
MGQVLGFSHCQEYGSVASTPDSTPPCTDGGNDESEMYELQTAREWSDDEDPGEADDDEGLTSSPSIWGTPRQNSFELTFSYIAIAEAEAVGVSRLHRERRRGGFRGSRTSLMRADTLETLLDSPDVDWDPQGFISHDDDVERREPERLEAGTDENQQTETLPFMSQNLEPESQESDSELQRAEVMSQDAQPDTHSSQQQPPSQITEALEPEPPITVEAISVELLTSARPKDPAGSAPADTGFNSQEQLVGGHWFSAVSLKDELAVCTHIAVVDLIYWKDMERSGMVLTGLVVGLLSLFQLSIITVVSTVSLAVMCFTISVRIYYQLLYVLSWGDGEHPFKSYLNLDISFSGEQADLYMQKVIVSTLSAVDGLKKLFFVGNLFDSLKFLFLLYLVTYLGDLCNGLTLLIISVIAVFSLPLFYKRHQEEVDRFVAKIQAQLDSIKDTLQRLAQGGGPPPDPTPGGAKPKPQ